MTIYAAIPWLLVYLASIVAALLIGYGGRLRDAVTLAVLLSWLGVGIYLLTCIPRRGRHHG